MGRLKKKEERALTRKQQHQRRRQRDVLPFASRGRSSGVDDLLEDFTYSSSSFSSFIFFFFTTIIIVVVVVSYVFLAAFGIHRGRKTRPMGECLRGKKTHFLLLPRRGNSTRKSKKKKKSTLING